LGLELGLFTKLGSNSMTGRELQEALGLSARANPDFFDALVALRFLERDGDGPDARYRNMPETAVFLDRNDPGYIGGILEKKMQLIQAVYDALPAGGAFVVIENLIDDARRENVFGLMMSLNMLIEFGDAFDFTAAVAYK
ncbi:MAG: methyltransferase, partial [Blastocatellia bacterium]